MRSACAPGCAIGIRPVPTWKSTAAAPTPIRGGPMTMPSRAWRWPSPFWPWQKAQPTRNSSRPLATCSASVSAWPGLGGREGGVQGTGQQQAEQQHDEPGERPATVPRDSTGGAIQKAHVESSDPERSGYWMT